MSDKGMDQSMMRQLPRETRYAEAIVNAALGLNPSREWASTAYARAVMAVADEEQADLIAEVERLTEINRELVDTNNVYLLTVSRTEARAEAAEAEVRDLRAKVARADARISASDLIVKMRELTYFGESQIAGHVVSRMMRERASVGRTDWDARGGPLSLSREEWGVVVDALIQHRDHATERKADNVESTSDMRADMCGSLIERINNAASVGRTEPALNDNSGAGMSSNGALADIAGRTEPEGAGDVPDSISSDRMGDE